MNVFVHVCVWFWFTLMSGFVALGSTWLLIACLGVSAYACIQSLSLYTACHSIAMQAHIEQGKNGLLLRISKM